MVLAVTMFVEAKFQHSPESTGYFAQRMAETVAGAAVQHAGD